MCDVQEYSNPLNIDIFSNSREHYRVLVSSMSNVQHSANVRTTKYPCAHMRLIHNRRYRAASVCIGCRRDVRAPRLSALFETAAAMRSAKYI